MCLGRERERFERELARGAALDAFAVVCEGSWLELSRGEYRSRLNPHAACQSVLAFAGGIRLPFLLRREPERGGIYDVGISPAISGRGAEEVEGHCRGARGGVMLVNVSVRGVCRNHPKLFKPGEMPVEGMTTWIRETGNTL